MDNVTVEQVDRDAAADLHAAIFEQSDRSDHYMRTGELDFSPSVQAFARHRLASEQSRSTDGEVDKEDGRFGVADRATRASPRAPTGLGHSASIASAEDDDPNPVGTLRQQAAWRIQTANVPHPLGRPLLGGLETRSLGYYLSVGIDHFTHPHERYNALLFKATDAVIELLTAASGIEARSDETPQAAQPVGREPDPKGDAQTLESLTIDRDQWKARAERAETLWRSAFADHMTSEQHHPGYVLISTAAFDEARQALEETGHG